MKYHSQRPGSKIMHLFRNWGSFWRKHHSYDSIIKEWNQAYFCRSYAVVCVISPCIAENILGSVWEWGYSNPTLCRKMIIIPYPHISLWIWGRRKSLIVGDVMDDFRWFPQTSIFFMGRNPSHGQLKDIPSEAPHFGASNHSTQASGECKLASWNRSGSCWTLAVSLWHFPNGTSSSTMTGECLPGRSMNNIIILWSMGILGS